MDLSSTIRFGWSSRRFLIQKVARNKEGGGPGRPASSDPLSGMSGQPDGGRLAGRVLAYLYNPGWKKKVPVETEKSDKIFELADLWTDSSRNQRSQSLSDATWKANS